MRRSAGDRLVASREEIAALGDLATQDPLSLATQRYAQLRRFAPAFLAAFEFDTAAAGHDLQAAVVLLRELNRTGKRHPPRHRPDAVSEPALERCHPAQRHTPHGASTKRRWSPRCVTGCAPAMSGWQAARTTVDSTPISCPWTTHSASWATAHWTPTGRPGSQAGASGSTTGSAKCARSWWPVASTASGSRKSRLKITPYDPLTPPAGERLDRTIDALMPRIRITDLLWDVHAFTGFLDAFTDLRSGRVPRQSGRAPRLDSRRRHQPGTGAHGASVERREPCTAVVGQRLVSAVRNLRQMPWRGSSTAHHALPVAGVCGSFAGGGEILR